MSSLDIRTTKLCQNQFTHLRTRIDHSTKSSYQIVVFVLLLPFTIMCIFN